MMKPVITWIVIVDGARGRVMQNCGPGKGIESLPDLVFEGDHRRSADIAADRPGRTFDSVGSGRHAMEAPQDPHELLKAAFVQNIADMLTQRAADFDRLILVAPPPTLGLLRKSLSKAAAGKVTSELGKDLTHVPNDDLAKHLEPVVAL